MKSRFLIFIPLLILLTAVLSACGGSGQMIASSWPGVTLADDTAYIAHAQHVYAVRLSNGVEKWRYPEKADAKISFYATPAISPNEQIIVGGYDHVLYGLNANGLANWQFKGATDRFIAAPLATEKGIFAPNGNGKLYALDQNGQPLWQPSEMGGALWAQPVTDDLCECLYLSSMDHHVYAVNPQSGAQLWKSEDLGGAIVGTPTLSESGILYVGTFGSEILALDSKDGRVLWRKPTDGWVWSSPTLADGRLYLGDLSGAFYAFDAQNGDRLWRIPPNQANAAIAGAPLVSEGVIYFTNEAGSLFAVNTAGIIEWSQAIGGKIYAPPLAAGDMLLVAPSESEDILIALTKEGAIKWRYNPNPKQK